MLLPTGIHHMRDLSTRRVHQPLHRRASTKMPPSHITSLTPIVADPVRRASSDDGDDEDVVEEVGGEGAVKEVGGLRFGESSFHACYILDHSSPVSFLASSSTNTLTSKDALTAISSAAASKDGMQG